MARKIAGKREKTKLMILGREKNKGEGDPIELRSLTKDLAAPDQFVTAKD